MSFPQTADVMAQLAAGADAARTLLGQYQQLTATYERQIADLQARLAPPPPADGVPLDALAGLIGAARINLIGIDDPADRATAQAVIAEATAQVAELARRGRSGVAGTDRLLVKLLGLATECGAVTPDDLKDAGLAAIV